MTNLPSPTVENYEWQFKAACVGMDSNAFFYEPAERGHSKMKKIRAAKAVCKTCPVINECLKHALDAEEPYGVWGGLSEEERQVLLGRRWRR